MPVLIVIVCVVARAQGALLAELAPYLAPGRPLVAARAAVAQFEALADMFAGPRERARWAQLKARLTIFPSDVPNADDADLDAEMMSDTSGVAHDVCGEQVPEPPSSTGVDSADAVEAPSTARVERLAMAAHQKEIFGVGDALRAVTLTANGGAARAAEQQGVVLEVRLHRAVWLTGM